MTKVQKIREEVERLKKETSIGLSEHENGVEQGRMEILNAISLFLDSMEEEPVSEDKMTISKEWFEHCKKSWYNEGYIDGEYNRDRQFEEPVSEDLEEYINELSKQFPDVSFAKLSRIAVRVAKWQKEQFEKYRLAHCDAQTEEEAEIERDFVIGIIEKEHRQPTFDDAIKYGMILKEKEMQSTIELAEDHAMLAGMEKMKEEMMEKAVETTFNVSLPSGLYDKLWIKGCKECDKLLVIKKDEL